MRWINPFSTLFFDLKIAAKPSIMKAILRHPRKDPENGLFDDRENAQVFLPLLQALFPTDPITPDDFLLTCAKEYVNNYRQPILRFIGPHNFKKHEFELQKIVEETLDSWEEKSCGGKINATELSLVFTTHVISRLLLGHPGPYDTYLEIAYAIDYLNKYMMKKIWKQPLSTEDKAKYATSVDMIRQAITTSLNATEKPTLGSLVDFLREESQMSDLQVKTTLLVMYLGGSETAASLLNYLLWQLGQHPDYQEDLFRELKSGEGTLFENSQRSPSMDKLFAESIRLYTPAYVIGRQPAADLQCKVKNKQGEVLFAEKIKKSEGLLCGVTFAARDPLHYDKPDTFDPEHFQSDSKTLPWLPFGDGKHACPGQWLAKAEIVVLVASLVLRFKIESFPSQEIEQKGFMTLKPSEDVWVSLIPRKST